MTMKSFKQKHEILLPLPSTRFTQQGVSKNGHHIFLFIPKCVFKIAKVGIYKQNKTKNWSCLLTDFGNYGELCNAYNPREDYLYRFQEDPNSLNVLTF